MNKTCQKVKEYVEATAKALKMLEGGPPSFYFEKMQGYADGLFNRFAPFKKGDRIALSRTPDISSKTRHGWMGSKHFLIKGARGTIQEVDFDSGKFEAYVTFDADSYVGYHTNAVVPIKDKGHFLFTEDFLEVIS